MRQTRLDTLLAIAILALSLGLCAQASDDPALPPDRVGLKPTDIVRMQLDALQTNGQGDDGIALVWEFTSPRNQQVNGPLPRFVQMIHHGFADLLNSQSYELGQAQMHDGNASVPVRLTCAAGNLHGYVFWLSLDHDGERDGHWLTEGVTTVDIPQPQTPPAAPRPPAPPTARKSI